MAFFEYLAADSSGNLKTGQMQAVDKKRVIDFLKSQNLLVVKVKVKSASWTAKLPFSKRLSYVDKINFTGNLSTMVSAGVNLSQALEVLSSETKNTYFRSILGDLRFAIENGRPLSEALGRFPKDFDPVFINIIKAGEASGKLDEALARLNNQLKKDYSLISKVKGALVYPAVLIAGVLGVLTLIITFVIPRLANVFEGSSLKIPWSTKALFFLARIASFKPALTIIVLFSLLILVIFLFRLRQVRSFFNQLFFRLPITSTLLKQIELTRFAQTTSGLLSSGVPIGKVLEISASGMSLAIYKEIVLKAREKILKGVSLANAFRGNEKYFPGLLVSVINVGEKTGQLDKLLASLAQFYEEQADNSLKTMSGLVEPILLVIVGLLIGGMAISIVVPIYQLIGTI